MASSGVLRSSTYPHRGFHLELRWWVSSTNVANNTSYVKYELRGRTDSTGYSNSWLQFYNTRLTINGSNLYNNSSRAVYKDNLLTSGGITIKHNNDGTKNVSVSFSANGHSSSGTRMQYSGSISLDRINRGISNLRSTGWGSISGTKTFTFDNPSSATVVKLWWRLRESSGNWSTWYGLYSSSGKDYRQGYKSGEPIVLQSWTNSELAKHNPNRTTGRIQVAVWSYVGSTSIQEQNLEWDLPFSTSNPTASAEVSFLGREQAKLGSPTRGLLGVHTLRVNPFGSGQSSAGVSRYEITFDGETRSTTGAPVNFTPKSSGTKTVTTKTIDTRGKTSSKNYSVTVLPYSRPTISQRGFRSTNGRADPLGPHGTITGNVLYTTVTNASGGSANSPWWKINLQGRTNYRASISYTTTISSLDEAVSYTIEYGDTYSKGSVSGTISSGQAPLVLGKESVGINTVPPANSKGLFIQDSLVNGMPLVPYLQLWADYNKVGGGNYIEAVKQNWNKIPSGISLAETRVGSRGVAIIFKYYGEGANLYGSVVTFGYSTIGGAVKRHVLSNGSWYAENEL